METNEGYNDNHKHKRNENRSKQLELYKIKKLL